MSLYQISESLKRQYPRQAGESDYAWEQRLLRKQRESDTTSTSTTDIMAAVLAAEVITSSFDTSPSNADTASSSDFSGSGGDFGGGGSAGDW